MNDNVSSWREACHRLQGEFFEKYPSHDLPQRVQQALESLLQHEVDWTGAVGGWAGGIVYAVGSSGCGVPGVMNADLEAAFGTTMSTIRKRAEQVKELLGLEAPLSLEGFVPTPEFTLCDEANAVCAYAFRNGPIEDIHASGRISDPEMKHLMIKACESMAKLLIMKRESPAEYDAFIRDYNRKFCSRWER